MLDWHKQPWERFSRQLTHDKTPHALLVSGPPGVGKQAFAQAMAARLLCESPRDSFACDECRGCRLRLAGSHPDYRAIQPEEGGSGIIRIDAIRELAEFTHLSSQYEGSRVVLLHPAEAMNRNTANALLKTLEEPPPQVVLILVSHAMEKLPPTIRSRCQVLPIDAPVRKVALRWLQEQGLDSPEAALHLAGGAPLAALSIAKNQTDAKYLELGASVSDLIQAKASVVEIAEGWRDWGAVETTALMQRLVADLRHAQVGSVTQGLPASALSALAAQFSPIQLHQLMDELVKLRAAAAQPLSKELSVEACFLLWAEEGAC